MSARGHSSSDPGAAGLHPEFMAFAGDEESQGVLRGWAARQGFPAATVQAGGPELFAQMLESAAPPKTAVVDIDGHEDPGAVVARLVSLCGPASTILAIGSANDVGLYRRITGAGAVDYLVKPLTAETLNPALASALRGGGGAKAQAREARIIVVMGTRGGVGASTIAMNIGWLVAHDFGRRVALLDLDLQYGTSALALDLEPGRGLRDIVSSPQRVDSLMIASSMAAESESFSILGGEEAIDEVMLIDGGAIAALLKDMRGNFDIIVVDLPRHMLAAQKRLLAAAQEIVLVTELSLAGIRDTLRIKSALKGFDCGADITLVASRTSALRAGHVDRAAFEKGAQSKIDFTIPEDHKTVSAAANGGKAIGAVSRQAPVTRALLALAVKTGRLSGAQGNAGPWWKNPMAFLAGLPGAKKKGAP